MGSIPLPALDIKTPQQPDMMGEMGNVMRLQALRQQMANAPLQTQMLQQQVQEGQQNIAARQALNAAYAGAVTKDESGNPTIDANKLAEGLAKGPAAYQTPAVLKGITDFQKSRLDLQTTAADLQTKQADLLGNAASAVKAANYDPTLAHSLLDSLPPSPQLAQIRAQIDNPQALKQLVDTAIANSPGQQKLQNAKDVANIRANTPDMQAMKQFESQGGTPLGYQQHKVDVQTQADIARETNPAVMNAKAKLAGQEAAARQPYEMALARQRQALSQGDPNAAGQLLVDGDATLAELKSRGATPDFIARALFAAKRMSGGKYNAQAADAQFDVAKSPANVAFFGSAKSLTDPGGTLDQLANVAKDLPAGQLPALNSIADWEKAATGTGPIAHYAATALGVADDYAKVMGGGQGSDTSRLQALNLIKTNQSPEARAGSIQGIHDAVMSQTTSRIGKNPVLQRMYGGEFSGANQRPAAPVAPAGATMKVPGSDGKLHWSDGKKDLGVVQ